MSNNQKTKPVRMSLGQFWHHVEESERVDRQRTRTLPRGTYARTAASTDRSRTGSGAKLSDRLKARQGDRNQEPRRLRSEVHAQTAARIVGGSGSGNNHSKSLEINDNNFPTVSGLEAPDAKIYGAWALGVQPILDAKDLPDPKIVQDQERRAMKAERLRRIRQRRQYDDYTESDYSESEYDSDDYDYSDNEQNSPANANPDTNSNSIPTVDPLAPVGADNYSDDDDWNGVL